MKKAWIHCLIAIIFSFQFILPVSALSAAKPAPKPIGPKVGQFIFLNGTVTLERGGVKSKPAVRADLHEGDTIVTGKNSSCRLMLLDDSVLTIDQNSRFTMKNFALKDQTRTAKIFLAFGKVIADVKRFIGGKNQFMMESPTVVAGLRGTVVEFAVVIGANGVPTTTITCVSGAITVTTASGTVTLVAGQTAVAVASAAPAITTATTAAAAAGAAGGAATSVTLGAGTVAMGSALVAATVAAGVAVGGGGGGGGGGVPPIHVTPTHH